MWGISLSRIARVLVERERQVNVLPAGEYHAGVLGILAGGVLGDAPPSGMEGHCWRCVSAVLDGQAYSECALGPCWRVGARLVLCGHEAVLLEYFSDTSTFTGLVSDARCSFPTYVGPTRTPSSVS